MLERLGLGGDGDEIEAIEDVERDFGVRIDTSEAVRWRTVGDVYHALLLALPDDVRLSRQPGGASAALSARSPATIPKQLAGRQF